MHQKPDFKLPLFFRGRFILKSSHGQRRDSTLITGRTNVKVEVLELERSIQLEEAPSLQEEIGNNELVIIQQRV